MQDKLNKIHMEEKYIDQDIPKASIDEVLMIVDKLFLSSFSSITKDIVRITRKRVHVLMEIKYEVIQIKDDLICEMSSMDGKLNMLYHDDPSHSYEDPSSSQNKLSKEGPILEYNDEEVYNLDQNPLELEKYHSLVRNYAWVGKSMTIEKIHEEYITEKGEGRIK